MVSLSLWGKCYSHRRLRERTWSREKGFIKRLVECCDTFWVDISSICIERGGILFLGGVRLF